MNCHIPLAPKVTIATLDYAPAGFHPGVLAGMYGSGSQGAYRAAGEQAIESVALKILAYKAALIRSPATKNPFLDLLKELSLRRHRHAVEAQSPEADLFGQARELTFVPFKEITIFLGAQYREWGDQLKAFISAKLEAYFEASAATSLPTTTQFTFDEKILGQRIRVTFDLLNMKMLKALYLEVENRNKGGMRERYYRYVDVETELRYKSSAQVYCAMIARTAPLQAMMRMRVTAGESSEKVISEYIAFLRQQDQKRLFSEGKRYKEELASGRCLGEAPRAEPYPDYEQRKLAMTVKYYLRELPSAVNSIKKEGLLTDGAANPHTHFVVVTLAHTYELASKGFEEQRFEPLTRYFVPLKARPDESVKITLDRMLTDEMPLMLHQDSYLVQTTLQLCSSLFEKIMLWKASESPILLKEQMAGLIWLLAHNHRDVRGTASATEWLERAIYKAHGFALRTLTTRMIDCAALTTPLLSEFVPTYVGSLTLEPLPLTVVQVPSPPVTIASVVQVPSHPVTVDSAVAIATAAGPSPSRASPLAVAVVEIISWIAAASRVVGPTCCF